MIDSFEKLIKLRVVARHEDGVTVSIPLRAELMNSAGVLHGGVIATLADEAVGMAVSNHTKGKRQITTTELKVNYLLPVTGKRLSARCYLVRTGRHLCVGRVDLFDSTKRLTNSCPPALRVPRMRPAESLP